MSSQLRGKFLIDDNVLACIMYVVALIPVFPLSNIGLPLIIWLVKKDKSKVINEHGKNILNFQISFTIALFGLMLIGMGTFFSLFIIPIVTFIGFGLIGGNIILTILGAVKAYQKALYNLPFKIELIN